MSQLILASASPQRRELLEQLGLPFSVQPSDVDESLCREGNPVARAQTLALLKAQSVAAIHSGATVIGCDTLVVSHRGMLLEKPEDETDARRMLVEHSGATSTVHSALCVLKGNHQFENISSSQVTFNTLSQEEIDWWINGGNWRDRSGGFQIDGPGQLLISHIEGDWTSIVGLPVFLLGQLLRKAGHTVLV